MRGLSCGLSFRRIQPGLQANLETVILSPVICAQDAHAGTSVNMICRRVRSDHRRYFSFGREKMSTGHFALACTVSATLLLKSASTRPC